MKRLGFILVMCLMLVGCGSEVATTRPVTNDKMMVADNSGGDFGTNAVESVTSEDAEVGAANPEAGSAEEKAGTGEKKVTVNKEMIVYRGNVSVDTLNFQESMDAFRKMVEDVDGFVDHESTTDNNNTEGEYWVEDAEKHKTYTATIRVPSNHFKEVMNRASEFGDVRSSSSQAENVTQEYGTYGARLKVYEAEEERYLKMLKKTTDDKLALDLQKELFNVQTQIAEIRSQMTNLETDVAYSYLDVTIREVRKYEEKPVSTDTFWDRFKKTCSESLDSLQEDVEEILFGLISIWYYLIVVAIIVMVVRKKVKIKKENKGETETKE